jgi:rSAM-associated Gly-rich repeat protein
VSLRQKYVKILSGMLPAGAVGMSLLLGSTTASVANEHPTASQPSASKDRLSERLAAIREAVSTVTEPDGAAAKPDHRDRRLAWGNWWGGGWGYRPWGGYGYGYGYGWPNWNNWHNWNNWNNYWRNW